MASERAANAEVDAARVLNINVGVLGHVDSGKTSLGEATPCAHVCRTPPAVLTASHPPRAAVCLRHITQCAR